MAGILRSPPFVLFICLVRRQDGDFIWCDCHREKKCDRPKKIRDVWRKFPVLWIGRNIKLSGWGADEYNENASCEPGNDQWRNEELESWRLDKASAGTGETLIVLIRNTWYQWHSGCWWHPARERRRSRAGCFGCSVLQRPPSAMHSWEEHYSKAWQVVEYSISIFYVVFM